MDRAEFLNNKHKSKSTILNYKKAFNKLDSFLESQYINENTLIERLNNLEIPRKYSILQKIIDHIDGMVSPRVTKEYFNIIYSYFLLKDLPLDERQRKLRLNFPRESKPRFEGLDRPQIEKIIEYDEIELYRAYYGCGYGAGMRETEILLLKPHMIKFDETPVRLILPKEITKFSIPRETFISEIPGQRLKKLIWNNSVKENQFIFIKDIQTNNLVKFEKHFAKIRKDLAMETPNRAKHAQNDITLHSFRAFFDTVFTDMRLESFGGALLGHSKYMDTYYRKSLRERQKMFQSVEEYLNF